MRYWISVNSHHAELTCWDKNIEHTTDTWFMGVTLPTWEVTPNGFWKALQNSSHTLHSLTPITQQKTWRHFSSHKMLMAPRCWWIEVLNWVPISNQRGSYFSKMINLRLSQQQNGGNENNMKACVGYCLLSTLNSLYPPFPEKRTSLKRVVIMGKTQNCTKYS